QQITEAFPWENAPRFLLRDRDGVYAAEFRKQVKVLDIEEVRTAPRSPWQNPFVERIIGSVRRDCLDHVIIFSETHLQRVLAEYFEYYHRSRTHLSLPKGRSRASEGRTADHRSNPLNRDGRRPPPPLHA